MLQQPGRWILACALPPANPMRIVEALRARGTWAAVSVVALLATACASLDVDQLAVAPASSGTEATASEAKVAESKAGDRKGPPRLVDLARANAANPHDVKVALGYARGLKKEGRLKEAATVLETASRGAPVAAQAGKPVQAGEGIGTRALIVDRGLLALELGQAAEAKQLLAGANDPKARDWRVLSGLGIAAATLGQQAEAQRYFQSALELAPDNASVLNNLAMSYMLDKKIDKAEQLLRRAAKAGPTKPRVAQNLQLAVSLRAPKGDSDQSQPRPVAMDASPPMGLTKTPTSTFTTSAITTGSNLANAGKDTGK